MRRYTTFLTAVLALSAIASHGSAASGAAASIKIKLATLAPKGTSYHRLLLGWARSGRGVRRPGRSHGLQAARSAAKPTR